MGSDGNTGASLARTGSAPEILIVMGVSGSGKSTIGGILARCLGWDFEDADWFHPPANVEKMHSGIPLSDQDREPWLKAIASWIDGTLAKGEHAVVACSALKRRYRAKLIVNRPSIRLIYLKGDEALISRRLAMRHEHFMPASLLHSQFEALEEPQADENPIIVSIERPPKVIADRVLSILRADSAFVSG